MPETKPYEIKYDDGTSRFLLLDADDVERWRKLANDKTTDIKSVAPGTPTPINAASD
jgi:hypothetical protein